LGTDYTFALSCSDQENHLPVLAGNVFNESSRWLDLQPLSAPSELWARSRIPPSDKVYPEGVFNIRFKEVRLKWHAVALRSGTHRPKRVVHPLGDDGIFNKCVGGDHVDGFFPLIRFKRR